jgi:succinoglycan biosynthesis protein ExoA
VSGPRVTVVIPVRDEVERLAGCLDSVAAQDFPPELVEVLVVDGGSCDGTVEVARRLLAGRGWKRAEVLSSAAGDRSSNLNCGLASSGAPVLVRVDARSRIPAHYLRRCVELLGGRPELAVVGGRQRAVPKAVAATAMEAGVARALNNRWGMGLARYRRAGASGEADTVYLGAYRTSQLVAAGGWRTDFTVNEDFDLNRRLARFGVVWFDHDLTVDYVPRASLAGLARQYWAFGTGKARYWRLSGDRPRPRQLVVLAAPLLGLAGVLGTWALAGAAAASVIVAAGGVLAALVEVFGADGPPGGLRVHLAAVAALGCIAGAWLAGVAAGALTPVAGAVVRETPVEQAA